MRRLFELSAWRTPRHFGGTDRVTAPYPYPAPQSCRTEIGLTQKPHFSIRVLKAIPERLFATGT